MGVLKKINKIKEIKSWEGELPVESLYTVGIAGEKFFRAIKEEGKFLATYCPKCDFFFLPPKIYCEFCFESLFEWHEVRNRGSLESYTVLFVGPNGESLAEPEIIGLVNMENTDTFLIHRLGEVSLEDLEIGMSVEAVFREKEKREGAITDILYFRPVAEINLA